MELTVSEREVQKAFNGRREKSNNSNMTHQERHHIKWWLNLRKHFVYSRLIPENLRPQFEGIFGRSARDIVQVEFD
jgi:hypothetical protein